MSKVLDIAVKQPLTVRIGDKELTLEFPIPAIVVAEKKLGKSLKTAQEWCCLNVEDVPALLEAGLSTHHGEAMAAQYAADICGQLGPEGLAEIIDALVTAAWPRFIARVEERLKRGPGKPPNAQSGDAP